MSFAELFSLDKPVLSFEFFPPKSEDALDAVQQKISELAACEPTFMTVTYGAGGGTRRLTRRLVSFICNKIPLPAAAHLTCVGHSIAEIDGVLDEFAEEGISHIVALRGDPPKGEKTFTPHPEGFSNAQKLTAHIAKRKTFSVAVAGYPESHQEALSPDADLDFLKQKVDAGAELVITQLFFEEEMYFRFRDKAVRAGIQVPIVPGIMPIGNVSQIKRFTSMCGASIPDRLLAPLSQLDEKKDSAGVVNFGTEEAARMAGELLKAGAPGLHIYTLNKSVQTRPIVERLRSEGLLPKVQASGIAKVS